MNLLGKILIVDDDPGFLQTFRNVLVAEGYQVGTAQDRGTALAQLDQGDWDLILLDMKLQDRAGPNEGLDLFPEVQKRAPFAKAILVTAYASAESVERAFALGFYDYLQKDEIFEPLLRAKARNATEAARERRLAQLKGPEMEEAITRTWLAARTETNRNLKGALLEELMLLLFGSIPGFSHIRPNRRNDIEEIDLVIRNESQDALWSKEGQYFLVECKNWSGPVGKSALADFQDKLEERYGRCRLGFFVAVGDFARTFEKKRQRRMTEEILVVPIGAEDLVRLVQAADRNEELKALHERAVLAANGGGHGGNES